MQYTKEEKKVIRQALKALGKENLTLIVHGGSFPSEPNKDYGFGTYNSEAAKNLMQYISGVFNSIQLGPAGKTKKGQPSPYMGTIFSLNPLFIDLEQLTQAKWKHILSVETYKKICYENPKKGLGEADYDYAYEKHEEAMQEAFDNFDKADEEYLKFVKDNESWLEPDALYEALAKEHKNDYWLNWKIEDDKNLFRSDSDEDALKRRRERIKEVKIKHADVIDFYKFCQYVIWKQNLETKKYAQECGIKMIADRQVAFSDRDIWANQELFLDDWRLGCPPDSFSKDGQPWGFPVVDPKMLFNEDGTLGKAGKLIKNLYKKMFSENSGGIRIDHVVGLIDPWIYKKGCKSIPEEGGGRLYSSPEHEILYKYAIASKDDLNLKVPADSEQRVKKLNEEQIKRYAAFMEKLIVEAAQESGLTKDAIICEDLGSQTFPVETVMEKYKLNGMRLIQFVDPNDPKSKYRSSNVPENCWIMAGTHDSEPISLWAKNLTFTHISYLHALQLTEDVYPYLAGEEREKMIIKLTQDARILAKTKMTELFTSKSKNIQIFFADFFGIQEIYNQPGDPKAKNWILRIPQNFESFHKDAIENGFGFDIVSVLIDAIKAKGSEFINEHRAVLDKLQSLQK